MRLGATAGAVACALAFSSCSNLGQLVGESDQTNDLRVAKVIVLLPDDGPGASDGARVAAAVESALAEVAIDGWEIDVEPVSADDTMAATAEAVKEIAGDRDVIAVIGGLTSDTVRVAQPILDRNTIPFISPADVAPEHTRGPDPSAPLRPYKTYFRAAVPNQDPVGLAARYAVDGLGADEIAVVQQGRVDEAARFAERARSLGADVRAAEPGDVESGASTAREHAAAAVYVAGDADFAATVTTEVVNAGLDAWVLGGADLHEDAFLAAAGAAASRSVSVIPGTLGPTADRPVPGLARAGRYGAAAHDAATALTETFQRCLPPMRAGRASSARKGCVAELSAVSVEGVTGTVAFDAYGDRQGAWPQAHVVVDGAWREVGSL